MVSKQDKLQEEIIDKTIDFYKTNNLGYLDLAMRSGKTKITLESIKRSMESSIILLCYPDNKLKESWKGEMEKWHFKNHSIDFVNFSSLHKYINNYYNFIICDEFHALSMGEAESLSKIIKNADKTIFLSGTISKETKEKWPEFKEIAKYTTNEGISAGILSDYIITVHLVDLDNKIKTPNRRGKLLTEKQKYDNYGFVLSNLDRKSKTFMHLALARNRLSLSSIGKIEYTKKLLQKLSGKRVIVFTGLSEVADNLGIPSYHSKSNLEFVFEGFQEGKFNQLALAAMGKTGITYNSLDSVILLNFTYNASDTSQQLNRCIKLDYSGKVADMHLIVLNEPPELKKVKESLSMLDQLKIKYV